MGKKEPKAPAGKSSGPSAASKGKKGGWPEKNTPARTELVRELGRIVSTFASAKQPVRGKQCAKKALEELRRRKPQYELKDELCVAKVAECLKNMARYASRSGKPSWARLRRADKASGSPDNTRAEYWESQYHGLKVKYDALLQEKNKLQMVSDG